MTEIKETCPITPRVFMTRELWSRIVEFFRMVHDKHKSEALVFLIAKRDDPYRIIDFVVPEQEASGSAVTAKKIGDVEGYEYHFMDVWNNKPELFIAGSMHSHASMSTFHSGTDDDDVKNQAWIGLNENFPFIDITSNVRGEFSGRICERKECGETITKKLERITFPDLEFDTSDLETLVGKVTKHTPQPTKSYYSYGRQTIPKEIDDLIDYIGMFPTKVLSEAVYDVITKDGGEELMFKLAYALYKLYDSDQLEDMFDGISLDQAKAEVCKRQKRFIPDDKWKRGTRTGRSPTHPPSSPSLATEWTQWWTAGGRGGGHDQDDEGAEEEAKSLLDELSSPKEVDPKAPLEEDGEGVDRNPHVG